MNDDEDFSSLLFLVHLLPGGFYSSCLSMVEEH
jgi:hypothetical protein